MAECRSELMKTVLSGKLNGGRTSQFLLATNSVGLFLPLAQRDAELGTPSTPLSEGNTRNKKKRKKPIYNFAKPITVGAAERGS
jgi:hypothetical protein